MTDEKHLCDSCKYEFPTCEANWDCCNGGEAAMTDDEVNKRLCELFELPFDEREGRYGHNQVNPKFQSPEGRIDLLRRMLGRDDWKSFLACLIGYNGRTKRRAVI